MIGRIVSQYEITEKLGRGGMGVVYKAFDSKLRRHVALKFLPPELSADAEAKDRFVQEARAAAALDHASICTIHEIGETGDSHRYGESQLFIAMTFYDGETLDRRLKGGLIPRDEALKIATEIAEGLECAHAAGIVHRDIKPANVMLTSGGDVKILDFGIAKLTGQTMHTRAGSTLGTAAYMSPEQARGEVVDGRSDLWSLGVVLYEMLAGRRPFAGEYLEAIKYAVLNEEPERLAGEDRNTRALVKRVLAKSPAARYADCGALLTDLRLLRSGQDIPVPVPWRKILAALAVVAGVVGGVVGYRWLVDPAMDSTATPAVAATETVPGDKERIAVLPFTYHGAQENRWLGKGLMELMITNLDGSTAARTVSGSTVLFAMASLDSVRSRVDGESVARFLNVARYVQGEIVAVGEHLRISAELHDRDAPPGEPVRGNVAGSTADLYDLVDELAGMLMVESFDNSLQRDAALARGNVDFGALKAFMAGLQCKRDEDDDGALAAFERAVAADSTFALAWYYLAEDRNSHDARRDAAVRAVELSGVLPERDQLMFSARLAKLDRKFDDAEQKFRQVLNLDSRDVKAMEALEGILWDTNRFRGRSTYEAIPYARRVVALAPDYRTWMRFHLTVYAIDTADLEYLADYPPCEVPFENLCPLSKLVQAYDRSPADVASVLDELSWGEVGGVSEWWTLKEFDRARTDPEVPLEMGRLMVAPTNEPGERLAGRAHLTQLYTARGRYRMARSHPDTLADRFEELEPQYPGFLNATTLALRTCIAAMPFIDLTPGHRDSLRHSLETWDAASVAHSDEFAMFHNGRHDLLRLYLLGLLDTKAAAYEVALQHAGELEDLASVHRDGALAADLAALVRARVALARGHGAEALSLLEEVPRSIDHWGTYSPILRPAFIHQLRGEIFYSLNQYDEALHFYRLTRDPNTLLFHAVRFYYQARCHEALGDLDDAIENYRRFTELWRDCDPDQRRLLDDAQRRLALLEPQG